MRDKDFRRPTHPTDGDWRAFLDGELPVLARLRLRRHAAHCPACRQRLSDADAAGDRASRLLGALAPMADVADSWERLAVLAPAFARPRHSLASAFMAGGLCVAALATSVLLLHPAPTRLLGRVHGVGAFSNVLDECCSAGGEAAREGVFTLELAGVSSPLKVRYLDSDGSGSFSSGDVVRSVSEVRRR